MLAHAPGLQGVHEGVQLLGGAERADAAVPDLHVDDAALPGHAPPVAAVLPVPAQRLPPYAAVLQRPLKLLLPPAVVHPVSIATEKQPSSLQKVPLDSRAYIASAQEYGLRSAWELLSNGKLCSSDAAQQLSMRAQSGQALCAVTALPESQVLHLCLLSFKFPVCFCLGNATLKLPLALVPAPLHPARLAECPHVTQVWSPHVESKKGLQRSGD